MVVADAITGLRAWSLKGDDPLVASAQLEASKPTSLAIDDTASSSDDFEIAIGFEDGSFELYKLGKVKRKLTLQYQHAGSRNGAIHAIAYASPYLVTMTGEPALSLYRFGSGAERNDRRSTVAPVLLSSLRSHTAYPPTALALRISPTAIIASIAYAVPTWTFGWSVGLQELRLSQEGGIMESRMAAAPNQNLLGRPMRLGIYSPTEADLSSSTLPKPTSISYNHPYLLSAHADNTLTLYMVTSTTDELRLGRGNRLWGHTSSVSGAHIGDRGKAVSVSTRGNELRVWELEGGLSSSSARRRAAAGEASVQVHPEKPESKHQPGVKSHHELRTSLGLGHDHADKNVTKGWVAFDEEKVVLLKEKLKGAQALVVYDFS